MGLRKNPISTSLFSAVAERRFQFTFQATAWWARGPGEIRVRYYGSMAQRRGVRRVAGLFNPHKTFSELFAILANPSPSATHSHTHSPTLIHYKIVPQLRTLFYTTAICLPL